MAIVFGLELGLLQTLLDCRDEFSVTATEIDRIRVAVMCADNAPDRQPQTLSLNCA